MLKIREVVKMRCEGMNPADIATKLGVETKAISSALCSYAAENGINYPKYIHKNKKWTNDDVNKWRELIKQGVKRKDVAETYGCTVGTISRMLAEQVCAR